MSSSPPRQQPTSPSTIPKINRIRKAALSPEEQPLQRLTTTITATNLLPQSDYLNIYRNLNVVFIGDNSIRILYRDLCKILKFNRLLEYTEAACQNGSYKLIEGKLKEINNLNISSSHSSGESRLRGGGRIGMDDYEDIKQFHLENNSTKLFYIHLSTILNEQISMKSIDYLREITDLQPIDAIIFCSYSSDMHR